MVLLQSFYRTLELIRGSKLLDLAKILHLQEHWKRFLWCDLDYPQLKRLKTKSYTVILRLTLKGLRNQTEAYFTANYLLQVFSAEKLGSISFDLSIGNFLFIFYQFLKKASTDLSSSTLIGQLIEQRQTASKSLSRLDYQLLEFRSQVLKG